MESNMVGWFEIPVTDMDRAQKFYESVFKIEISIHNFEGIKMGWFPFSDNKPGAAGSLIQLEEWYKPSNIAGVVIYFNSEDVDNELARIESAGGRVIKSKTLITKEIGYMGMFLDSEGNRIALHSRK
ncbi:VOC family protein [Urechidicola croceus]|uniref:Glyoxalase n=1 Tax=Urechidicola croceus TaxID=1850246 RepID=A0A1D8P6P3_9FLAO|nr:VOC family protein [Urechidicola croceus]AOW20238.1 glyoxalase [Urechidicola croceus]